MSNPQGKLSLVATPIGNLGDLTLRALECLKNANLILAEDTRRTRKLLSFYDIHIPLQSFYQETEHLKTPEVIRKIEAGAAIALVTDAGTPAVSDPGGYLIQAVIQAGLPLEILPGPSALLTALLGSGLPSSAFSFCGFLQARHGVRIRQLEGLKFREETLVFFVAPHHLVEVVQDMVHIFGDRPAALCREMTKHFEEFIRGPLSLLLDEAQKKSLGEYTLVVAGSTKPAPSVSESLEEEARRLQSEGLSLNQAIARIARERGLDRKIVYAQLHSRKMKSN